MRRHSTKPVNPSGTAFFTSLPYNTMKTAAITLVLLLSCTGPKATVDDLVHLSMETGRLRQEIAVKTVYPYLDWEKIDSVYHSLGPK